MALATQYDHVLVSRTFSKAFSLCFQRIGYFVGPAKLIEALDKVRDSYNVNGLGQVAAEATLKQMTYYRANFRKDHQTARAHGRKIGGLGFSDSSERDEFHPHQTTPLRSPHVVKRLRERKILVRWLTDSRVKDYLRITIGSEREMATLLREVKAVLKG